MAKLNKVCVNIDQSNPSDGGFTDAEKAQARTNIGAIGQSEIDMVTANRYNWSSPSVPNSVDEIKFNQKGASTTQIMADNTDLGSTVPLPTLSSDEGKVPVAYYRDGRGYYLLEQYKDTRLPDSDSTDVGKALVVDSHGMPTWDNIGGGSSISMASFRSIKTLNIPAGNSSMINDLYKIFDLPAKTAVNMTVFVRDMDHSQSFLVSMGISIWCGDVNIDANSFTRGSDTEISHAIPICYYNGSNSPIEIKIGFNGTFAQQALDVEMLGFTITNGV